MNGTTFLHTCLLYWEKANILSLYYNYGGNFRIVLKKNYECLFFANFCIIVTKKTQSELDEGFFKENRMQKLPYRDNKFL